MAFVPAVVVGDEGERRVGDLGFAGELGLLQIGHADDVHAPLTIDVTLSLGRERRPFHTDVRTAAMRFDAYGIARSLENIAKLTTNRMSKSHMPDDAVAEKCRFVCSCSRSVEELVRNHKIRRSIFLLKRADGRDRQNVLDAEHLHRVDVRPKGKFARRKLMPASMPRQKRHGHTIQFAHNERIRRRTKRRLNGNLPHILKFRHLVKTTASDYSDSYFFH